MLERRRDRLRDRRGPGAGRQAARGDAAACRRSRTSTTTTRAACATTSRRDELRRSCRSSAANSIARIPASSTREVAQGQRRRRRPSCSTRRAPPASPRACARRTRAFIAAAQGGCEFDQLDRRRQHPVLPADGVGRRPPVLVRAVAGRRLHDQLPRVGRHGDDRPARDRADVLLRAAARVREPADAGDDPHGGRERDQALRCSSYFIGVARRCGAEILDGKPVGAARPRCCTRSATCWSTGRCATCSA